jgi:hypothetical protein
VLNIQHGSQEMMSDFPGVVTNKANLTGHFCMLYHFLKSIHIYIHYLDACDDHKMAEEDVGMTQQNGAI